MASGNVPEIDRLEREQRRLVKNTSIGRPEEFLSNEVRTERL